MASSGFAPSFFAWILIFFVSDVFKIAFAEDGQWSEWKEWQPCSVSCGKGTRKRFRFCNNPPPSNGGANCLGKRIEKGKCNVHACPVVVDGEWSDWNLWSECSVTCGEGTRNRFRDCDSPPPLNGGRYCEGSAEEMENCLTKDCATHGQWSGWSHWSACSVTCDGQGTRERYRSCNNPPPSADGKPCIGDNKQARKCKATSPCPVNGDWSEWSEWSACSVTCGPGTRNRWRKCDNPSPQDGGLDCRETEAGVKQEISCNGTIAFCPVDGKWSDWSDWGECTSPDCTGLQYVIRERSCKNPYPAHKGSMCQGRFLDARLCEVPVNCRVDGQWSEWSNYECFEGYVSRKRKCDSPPRMNGGKQCPGENVENIMKDDENSPFEQICGQAGNNDNDEAEDNEEGEDRIGEEVDEEGKEKDMEDENLL